MYCAYLELLVKISLAIVTEATTVVGGEVGTRTVPVALVVVVAMVAVGEAKEQQVRAVLVKTARARQQRRRESPLKNLLALYHN